MQIRRVDLRSLRARTPRRLYDAKRLRGAEKEHWRRVGPSVAGPRETSTSDRARDHHSTRRCSRRLRSPPHVYEETPIRNDVQRKTSPDTLKTALNLATRILGAMATAATHAVKR